MGRILAIDYGLKRTGLAVTDPLKMIASPLETVKTSELIEWIRSYIQQETLDLIVVGMPTNLDQSPTHTTKAVFSFIDELEKAFPSIRIDKEDERFTSKMAQQSMIQGGMKKKNRREKANIDKISATIILQSYLEKFEK